jgi:hypothetical protein
VKQLSGMLESILDIQHPDRVQEKLCGFQIIPGDRYFPLLLQRWKTIFLPLHKLLPQIVLYLNFLAKGNTFMLWMTQQQLY